MTPDHRPPLISGRDSDPGRGMMPGDRLSVPRAPQTRPTLPDGMRGDGRPALPTTDHEGRPITDKLLDRAPKGDHLNGIRDTNIMARVPEHNRFETERGRYYWHETAGRRYCHYVDPYDRHWYGWSWGGYFFWSMWCGNSWWWYNTGCGCWNYWYGGYWWRYSDTHVTYVYIDNDYYEYNQGNGGVTLQAEASKSFYSEDGSRVVHVYGENNDAFLYDTAPQPAFDPVFLASKVKNVIFRNTGEGQLLKILVITEEASANGPIERFDEFDADGHRLALMEKRTAGTRLAQAGDSTTLKTLSAESIAW